MKKYISVILLAVLSLLSASCDLDEDKNEASAQDLDLVQCEEPRPQICTREYKPVCAELQDGSSRTDSTGCTACSDHDVVAYKPGAC